MRHPGPEGGRHGRAPRDVGRGSGAADGELLVSYETQCEGHCPGRLLSRYLLAPVPDPVPVCIRVHVRALCPDDCHVLEMRNVAALTDVPADQSEPPRMSRARDWFLRPPPSDCRPQQRGLPATAA